MAFASTLILAVAMVLLVQWRQTQFERERRQLEGERDRLAAQIAELKQRRDLLHEVQRLSTAEEFYVVLWLGAREAELRLKERVLRRIPLAERSLLPASGRRYEMLAVLPQRLVWRGLDIVPETAGCPPAHYCLVLAGEDFAALARLKPGTVLVVLP